MTLKDKLYEKLDLRTRAYITYSLMSDAHIVQRPDRVINFTRRAPLCILGLTVTFCAQREMNHTLLKCLASKK